MHSSSFTACSARTLLFIVRTAIQSKSLATTAIHVIPSGARKNTQSHFTALAKMAMDNLGDRRNRSESSVVEKRHSDIGIHNAPVHYGIRSIRSKEYKYIWNFTPEVKFSNNLTVGGKTKWGDNDMIASWREKAKSDSKAAEAVKKYEWRPAEELYAISKDKNEMINLASNPEYSEIKKELRKALLEYMEKTGDEGQQSELDAPLHQLKHKKKKSSKKR